MGHEDYIHSKKYLDAQKDLDTRFIKKKPRLI